MPKGLSAARRAVRLDPDLAEGHTALGLTLLLWERDSSAALAAFQRALELNPNYSHGRALYGFFYFVLAADRVADGIAELRRALEADPLSAYNLAALSMSLLSAGRPEESLEFARLAAERDPGSLYGHWQHQMAAQLAGLDEEATGAGAHAEAVSGGHPYPISSVVIGHIMFRRLADARIAYARFLDVCARRYVPLALRAEVAAAMGEQDRAMELAGEACDERDPLLLLMARNFPYFDRLRKDPRFGDIVRRLRLP